MSMLLHYRYALIMNWILLVTTWCDCIQNRVRTNKSFFWTGTEAKSTREVNFMIFVVSIDNSWRKTLVFQKNLSLSLNIDSYEYNRILWSRVSFFIKLTGIKLDLRQSQPTDEHQLVFFPVISSRCIKIDLESFTCSLKAV